MRESIKLTGSKNGYKTVSYFHINSPKNQITFLFDRDGQKIGHTSKTSTVMYGGISSEEIFSSESGNSSFTREK